MARAHVANGAANGRKEALCSLSYLLLRVRLLAADVPNLEVTNKSRNKTARAYFVYAAATSEEQVRAFLSCLMLRAGLQVADMSNF